MDNKTKQQRHDNMAKIKSRDTKPEIKLRKALWAKGIRYRKNYKGLIGKPDIAIISHHIVIFIDGDFWHGNLDYKYKMIATNTKFWNKKIHDNVERDIYVNEQLTEKGWLVIRFWESDIKEKLDECVKKVLSYIPDKI